MAFAISGTDQIAWEGKSVPADPDWPKGVSELVNDPLRTDGWSPWFSEWPNDLSHYGFRVHNTKEINQLIEELAAIQVTNAQVCLRPDKEVGPLGFTTHLDKGNNLAVTFSLGNQKRINQWFEHLEKKTNSTSKAEVQRVFGVHHLTEPPPALPPTLTLYVENMAVDLAKLTIPTKLKVVAEISKEYREKGSHTESIRAIEAFIAKH